MVKAACYADRVSQVTSPFPSSHTVPAGRWGAGDASPTPGGRALGPRAYLTPGPPAGAAGGVRRLRQGNLEV